MNDRSNLAFQIRSCSYSLTKKKLWKCHRHRNWNHRESPTMDHVSKILISLFLVGTATMTWNTVVRTSNKSICMIFAFLNARTKQTNLFRDVKMANYELDWRMSWRWNVSSVIELKFIYFLLCDHWKRIDNSILICTRGFGLSTVGMSEPRKMKQIRIIECDKNFGLANLAVI